MEAVIRAFGSADFKKVKVENTFSQNIELPREKGLQRVENTQGFQGAEGKVTKRWNSENVLHEGLFHKRWMMPSIRFRGKMRS